MFSYKQLGDYMDNLNLKVRSSEEYPEITNANNDPRVVELLKDLLASRDGEIEGILQYFYQSRIAKQVNKEISEILEEISIVEMEHMQLLMDAIIDFGGIPKYQNGKAQPYSTTYINYSIKLKDMLDINIQGEQQAIKRYTVVQELVSNQSLKKLLSRITEDEKLHLEAFKLLKNTVNFLSV